MRWLKCCPSCNMLNCQFRHLRHETNPWMSQINQVPNSRLYQWTVRQCQLQIIHHSLLCGVVSRQLTHLFSGVFSSILNSEALIENRYVVRSCLCCVVVPILWLLKKSIECYVNRINTRLIDLLHWLPCDDTIELNKHSFINFIGIELTIKLEIFVKAIELIETSIKSGEMLSGVQFYVVRFFWTLECR